MNEEYDKAKHVSVISEKMSADEREKEEDKMKKKRAWRMNRRRRKKAEAETETVINMMKRRKIGHGMKI